MYSSIQSKKKKKNGPLAVKKSVNVIRKFRDSRRKKLYYRKRKKTFSFSKPNNFIYINNNLVIYQVTKSNSCACVSRYDLYIYYVRLPRGKIFSCLKKEKQKKKTLKQVFFLINNKKKLKRDFPRKFY